MFKVIDNSRQRALDLRRLAFVGTAYLHEDAHLIINTLQYLKLTCSNTIILMS